MGGARPTLGQACTLKFSLINKKAGLEVSGRKSEALPCPNLFHP